MGIESVLYLIQHVSQPTHSRGHLLDLIRFTDYLVEEIEVKDMLINDHFGVHCNLGQKPETFRKEITFRKNKSS